MPPCFSLPCPGPTDPPAFSLSCSPQVSEMPRAGNGLNRSSVNHQLRRLLMISHMFSLLSLPNAGCCLSSGHHHLSAVGHKKFPFGLSSNCLLLLFFENRHLITSPPSLQPAVALHCLQDKNRSPVRDEHALYAQVQVCLATSSLSTACLPVYI